MDEINIRVVAYQEGDVWIAQGIEYDIVARARTLSGLPKAFNRALTANLCVNEELGRRVLDGIPAAPEHFKAAFERATMDLHPRDLASGPAMEMRFAEVA